MTTLPIASYCSADAAPSKTSQSCPATQAEPDELLSVTPHHGTPLSDSGSVTTISDEIEASDKSDEETVPLPQPLEVITPKERLPDVLDIYDDDTFRTICNKDAWDDELDSLEKFLARYPIRFVREYPYPVLRPVYTDTACDVSKSNNTLDHRTTGQLDLRQKKDLGDGSHSHVFLAPLTLPSCVGPTLCEVAVKISTRSSSDKKMLESEAGLYAKFPPELQESTPTSLPVVPKFYGYYAPSCESVDNYKGEDGDEEEDTSTVRKHVCALLESRISPILLLEPCGKELDVKKLSKSDKDTITGLYARLHKAGFTQGSAYPRNVLVQPGPLTRPPAERSLDNPSYRIVDFGRGERYVSFESQNEEQEKVLIQICHDFSAQL